MLEFLLVLAFLLTLLGLLARLTVGYSVNSLDLLEGDRDRPTPMWMGRAGRVS